MGLFDDIVPPDTASRYGPLRITVRPKGVEPPASPQPEEMPADAGFAPNQVEPWGTEDPVGKTAPSPRRGLFDDIVAPAVRVRTAGLSFGDGDKIVRQVAAPGKSAFIHGEDPPAPRAVNGTSENHIPPASAARADEFAQHKAAVESALSNTVPFRLQHSRPVDIVAGLMAYHGMPLDEALDRATMRLHAEEGTAQAGKISDVIGKDAFDEAQRAPASPDLAPPAPGVRRGHAATEEQARPDGEYASGDSAPQGGDAAAGKTIGSEDPVRAEQRAQSGGELISAAAEGAGGDQGFASGRNDAMLGRTSDEQHVLPTAERIGDDESHIPPAPGNLLWRLASPVTDIPHEIYQAGAESLGAANTYLNPWSEDYRKGIEAGRDKWIGTGPGSFLGTGKGLLAAIGVPFSPATGIFRSLIGHPLSVIMPTATPQEQERMRKAGISEDMIPGQTREENYQKIKRDVDLAMMAARPFGFTPRGPIPRTGPQPPARPPDAAAAQSDQIMSGARASGPFALEGKKQDTPGSGPQPPARPPDTAAAQSDRMNSGARESGPSSFEDKQQAVKTGEIAAVKRNALQGRAFEEEGLGNLNATHSAAESQVSVRPHVNESGTLAGYGVRLDVMSIDGKGTLQLTDFKSSASAGYTRNQTKGYPLLEQYGGRVAGKRGGQHYPNGFQIPPTKVTTIRPPDFKVDQ